MGLLWRSGPITLNIIGFGRPLDRRKYVCFFCTELKITSSSVHCVLSRGVHWFGMKDLCYQNRASNGTQSQQATTHSQRFLESKPGKYYQPCIWCISYSHRLERQGIRQKNDRYLFLNRSPYSPKLVPLQKPDMILL
ncbi:uncharacterized protein OCT59_014937 [Rhizophagus irregularis]|uniref:Uncharacterized protein n=1 Tax=Rhizophagus irregularis (strain DAOM 197198w) TaxID=1432141 RepID=A0A015IWU7_RHIIW|nr:hypothetical protein RirG_168470 [Rhizophagus irregularis DAOM 197198w]UZO22577.1 hypothetical protein OCT59_014937 [Rhizophagus irregularis]GBC43799.2 hypothetical protein GLOIN_2v1582480 [Rhizophagus irregularis DAOM 181602=DAOM 197198]